MPPDPRLDKEIILFGAVSADLAEGDIQTFGANTRSLGQDFAEIMRVHGALSRPRWMRSRCLPGENC
jgi:hypothetical protein